MQMAINTKAPPRLCLAALLALALATSLAAATSTSTPAQQLLARMPASARGSFLLYQLAAAINSNNSPWATQEEWLVEMEQEVEQQQFVESDSSWLAAMANEFQGIPVYENFPADLLGWLSHSYELSAADIYRSLAGGAGGGGAGRMARMGNSQQLCNADGQCYDVAQIGSVCCPF